MTNMSAEQWGATFPELYKEKRDGLNSYVVEVSPSELNEEKKKYREGLPHTHIFGPDEYAASGYYERKCVICGNIDYL